MYDGSAFGSMFSRIFPERQIYHRSSGTVRYVTLSPGIQISGFAILALVVSWFLYASISYVTNFSTRGTRSAESALKIATYEGWLRQSRAKESAAIALLEERTLAFSEASSEFERRHATLKSLLGSLPDENLNSVLPGPGSRQDGVLMRTSTDRADIRSSRITADPTVTGKRSGKRLRSRIDMMNVRQMAFLDTVEAEAVNNKERLQGLLQLTGIDMEDVPLTTDSGGPYLEIATFGPGEDDAFSLRTRQVAARLEESRQYEKLVNVVPLGIPVGAVYRLTSPFGRRVDPFTGRAAWHSGVDVTAYQGSTIISAAPGVITYAGRKSGYGRVVEVDHGYGFKTRYGHMKSIAVRKGDLVALGQRLGIMGSTGRSTGIHLHYEVSFRGKVYDPANFLEASRYVRKEWSG